MNNYNREQLLLELRNAVCDKEGYVANAYMETHSMGKWSCDWNHPIDIVDQKIKELLHQLNNSSIKSTNKLNNAVDTEPMLLSAGKITVTQSAYDNIGADLLRALSSSPNAEIEIIQD